MGAHTSWLTRALAAKVTALGLIDHDGESSTVAYASLIQTFNRYLLEQMTAESHVAESKPALVKGATGTPGPPLSQLIRLDAKSISTCSQCGTASSRDTSLNVIDLIYPRRVSYSHPSGLI